MRIRVRARTLTLDLALGVGDLSPGVLGTPFLRSSVVLPFTASVRGRCRRVAENARGSSRELTGLAPLLCDPCLNAGPGNLPVVYSFLDLIRKVYPFPRQDGEFDFLLTPVITEDFPRDGRDKLPRVFFSGNPYPFD